MNATWSQAHSSSIASFFHFHFFSYLRLPFPPFIIFHSHSPSANKQQQHELFQELAIENTKTIYHYQQHQHHNQHSAHAIPPRHPRNPRAHILVSRRMHPPPIRRLCLSSMAPTKSRSTPTQRSLGLFLEQGENPYHVSKAGWRCPVLLLLLG